MKKEPPLLVELMKFQKYVFLVNKHFPKQYKKNLGNDIVALTWEVVDSVMDCNDAPNEKKYVFLKKASSSFDKVRVRLRFGYEIGVYHIKDMQCFASTLKTLEGCWEVG